MKINVITLGCPKNTVDSEYLTGQLVGDQVQFIENAETADVVIINTCAFILPAREEAIEESEVNVEGGEPDDIEGM